MYLSLAARYPSFRYEKTFPLAGIDGPQRVELGAHRTRTLTLDRLIKCDNPSAFPALRQIEGYGR